MKYFKYFVEWKVIRKLWGGIVKFWGLLLKMWMEGSNWNKCNSVGKLNWEDVVGWLFKKCGG